MSLVMDGVRRSGDARVAAPVNGAEQPDRILRPTMKPISAATSRANRGVRYVTGMDGVRRAVGAAEPVVRERPMVMVAEQAVVRPRPKWQLSQARWLRPMLGAGALGVALVASMVTVRLINAPHTVTARAEVAPAVAGTVAPSPVATAVVATPTPTPTPIPTPKPVPRAGSLQQLLDNFVAANGNKFGIVVTDLKTGQTASVNANQQILSASLYKMFVAQRIYQRIDLGELTYGAPAGGGTGRTIEGCLTIMINISDNGCGRALGAILGWGSQNAGLKAEGYKETNLASPQQTSAEDVAFMLTRLYSGTLLSPASNQRFMALLKDQRVNNRLPLGLPKGTVIAHKTGDLNGVVHDAGIVFGPKTNYLVVVVSGPWPTPGTAPAKFINLSRQLWNYLEQ